MSHSMQDSTLALAGVIQAVYLVRQIAVEGTVDQHDYEVSIRSMFDPDPDTTESVYGGIEGVQTGLKILIEQIDNNKQLHDMDITKYAVSVMHLERKLSKQPEMLKTIATGMERARAQADHFTVLHENVIANLAGIYSETISKLTPRIIVRGDHGYLSNPDNASKVRALLLAAIRSALLWRQCGGSRLQLLFKRKNIMREAKRLIV